MDLRYSCLVFLLPILAQAHQSLPDFNDTINIPCPLDTTVQILTYSDWEAYQTVDGLWNGVKDSTVCIDLGHVQNGYVQAYVDVDQIDATRPVFLRWLSDSASAIPLTSNDEYALDMSVNAYPGALDVSSNCPGGPCTGWQAAVRIPDVTDTATALRWYQSAYSTSSWSGYPLHLCVPTEYFDNNALREIIVSMKLENDSPGQRIYLGAPQSTDLAASDDLQPLTQDNLPDHYNGSGYSFYPNPYFNYMVMYPDTTYPDANHLRYLDFSPIPNTPDPQQLDVELYPETGFNFQPYTDLRGGLVLGSDSVRHSVNVINNGADLCLSYQWVELVVGPGDQYTHKSGHVDFAGEHSCMQFSPSATLEVATGSTFHYGGDGRGMLFLRAGSNLQLDANAELDLRGTLVLGPRPDATQIEDLRVVLKDGAKFTFAPGSRIINTSGFGQGMMLEVVLDGGSVDLSGLSGPDRLKVRVIELPSTAFSQVKVLGNPVGTELTMEMSVRQPGTWSAHAIDMTGRTVAEASFDLSEGRNTISIPTTAWHAGSYLLELRNGDEGQVVRIVKP